MTDTAPLTKKLTADTDAVSKGSDADVPLGAAPYAGKVTAVTLITASTLTGANTNTITGKLINKGQSGSGSTVVAEKAFVSTVNATGNDETAITLSGTASHLEVAEGDVLAWEWLHVGEGLAAPAGEVSVKLERT